MNKLNDHLPVFVYGTLKQGHGNHGVVQPYVSDVMEDSILGGIYGRDKGFPVVTLKEDGVVRGELIYLNWEDYDKAIARMDRLEGHPNFYRRTKVVTDRGYDAWVYEYQGDASKWGEPIEDGVW